MEIPIKAGNCIECGAVIVVHTNSDKVGDLFECDECHEEQVLLSTTPEVLFDDSPTLEHSHF